MANPQTHHELTTSKGGPSVTHVRYRVVAFTMMLAAVTYLDRVCISIVAPNIMRDLRLTHIQMSYVFSAFTLAYAVFDRMVGRPCRESPRANAHRSLVVGVHDGHRSSL
jgi:sugar phosphate permease